MFYFVTLACVSIAQCIYIRLILYMLCQLVNLFILVIYLFLQFSNFVLQTLYLKLSLAQLLLQSFFCQPNLSCTSQSCLLYSSSIVCCCLYSVMSSAVVRQVHRKQNTFCSTLTPASFFIPDSDTTARRYKNAASDTNLSIQNGIDNANLRSLSSSSRQSCIRCSSDSASPLSVLLDSFKKMSQLRSISFCAFLRTKND